MRLLKEVVKSLLYRPRGVAMGARSFILRPYSVKGRACIFIGPRTSFLRGTYIHAIQSYAGQTYRPAITIGADVYIGKDVYMTAIQGIEIGDGSVLSDGVYLTDEVHGTDPLAGPIMQQQLHSKGPISIGSHCFLGFRVAVLPGVTLGPHCVVGANSTVTRSFPAYSMVAGSPARLIKQYSEVEGQWLPMTASEAVRPTATLE